MTSGAQSPPTGAFGRLRRSLADPASAASWLGLIAALVVLNLSVTFHNVWPTPWITTRYELSIEIALLVLALALYSEFVRPPSSAAVTVVALFVLALCFGRYAEVTAPALYGRPVNLYWDAPHVANVAAMLSAAASPWVTAAVILGGAALIGGLFVLIRLSLARIRSSLQAAGPRRVLALGAAVVAGLYVAGIASPSLPLRGWFSLPVTATYWRQAGFTLQAYRQARNPGSDLCTPPVDADSVDTAAAGADVVLMFMESYGATTWDRPELAGRIAPSRRAFAEAVEASGRQVVSAFVTSPTFGGASWLAHMTLMTGRPVRDNGTYQLLLTQDCEVMTRSFDRRGYRVVGLMPGLKRDWPEGSFYGFDALYGERALDYSGPDFGWWRIPDQFALARLDEKELTGGQRPPRFVFFPTISSHMPFRPTPPYQPDWSRLIGAEPYEAGTVEADLAAEPDWMNLGRDYAGTIAYTFDYLAGYLVERPDLDLFLILIGDHQPPAGVSGEGVRWDVPVHVVGRSAEVLDRLRAAGFVSGIEPDPAAIGEMHELTPLFISAASAASSGGDAVSGVDESGVDVAGGRVAGESGN